MVDKKRTHARRGSAALLLLVIGAGLMLGCQSKEQTADTSKDSSNTQNTQQKADAMASKTTSELPPNPALIEPGNTAPAFTLKDQSGDPIKLSDYKGKWVVLYFYPRDNTPGCTTEACGFRDSYDKLLAMDAVVLGISPDDAKSHQSFTTKYGLPFPLLIDPGQQVASMYGVWREKNMFGKKLMGIARTTYLIDPAGKVAHRWDKVSVGDHNTQVIAEINKLK